MIKEIASNNSSLASSPQNLPPTPPKTFTFHKNRSQSDMFEYQGNNAFFGNNFSLNTNSTYQKETVETRALSLLPGNFGDIKEPQSQVKFTLDTSAVDSDTQQDEIDDSTNNRGDGRRQRRVYRRSISCDPVASGELLRPLEDSSNLLQFVETEFPLQVGI